MPKQEIIKRSLETSFPEGKATEEQAGHYAALDQRIAKLYLMGCTYAAIADKCNISRVKVNNRLAAMRKQWRKEAIDDIEEKILVELHRIDQLEWETWKAYHRSVKKNKVGSAALLNTVHKCIEQRLRILRPSLELNVTQHNNFTFNSLHELAAEADHLFDQEAMQEAELVEEPDGLPIGDILKGE